jgi:hypothetical protein
MKTDIAAARSVGRNLTLAIREKEHSRVVRKS